MMSGATTAMIGLAGVAIGALIQYFATVNAQNRRALMEMRTAAYVDYIKVLVDLQVIKARKRMVDSHNTPAPSADEVADAVGRFTKARMRIAVYGSAATAAATSRHSRDTKNDLWTPESKDAFLEVLAAMRRDMPSQKTPIARDDAFELLFG